MELSLILMQEIPSKELSGNALIISNHQHGSRHPKTHGKLKIVFRIQSGAYRQHIEGICGYLGHAGHFLFLSLPVTLLFPAFSLPIPHLA